MSSDKTQSDHNTENESLVSNNKSDGVLLQDQSIESEIIISSDDELDSLLVSLTSEDEPETAKVEGTATEIEHAGNSAPVPANPTEDNFSYPQNSSLTVKAVEKPSIFGKLVSSLSAKKESNKDNEEIRKERLKQERIEQERIEQERIEQERIEQEKLKQEKLKQEKLKQEKLKREKLKREKLKREKLKQEKLKQEKLKQEKLKQEKLEQEKLEQEKLEQEKLEQEKLEQEKLKQEKLEQERLEREKLELEKQRHKLEQERLAFEKEKLEQERLEQEKLNQESLDKNNSQTDDELESVLDEFTADPMPDAAAITSNKSHLHKPAILDLAGKIRSRLKSAKKAPTRAEVPQAKTKTAHQSKTRIQHKQYKQPKTPISQKRCIQLCGKNKDSHNTEDLETISFDPADYMIAALLHSLEQAKQTYQLLQLKYNEITIVIDHTLNTVYCNASITTDKYANGCYTQVCQDNIAIHELNYEDAKTHKIHRREKPEFTHTIESFVWTTSLLTARGRLPEETDITKTIGLKSGLDLSYLEFFPHADEIATLLGNNPCNLMEIAKQLEIPQRYVFSFYYAALNLNKIEFNKSSKAKKSFGNLFRK